MTIHKRSTLRAAGIGAAIFLSGFSLTAHAGEAAEVRKAIAEAQGKIDSAAKIGATGEAGAIEANARSTLAEAEALFRNGDKAQAIAAAKKASGLADLALVKAHDAEKMAATEAVRDTAATTAVARERTEAANERADNAENSAQRAQESAAVAQQNAASAQAQADAMRSTPAPAVVATSTTTTATTDQEVVRKPVHRARHRVRHTSTATRTVPVARTTTTVTTDTAPQR